MINKLKFKNSFDNSIEASAITALLGIDGSKLTDKRVLQRYIFFKKRSDGSETVLDLSAVIETEGGIRNACVYAIHGTRSPGVVVMNDREKDYQIKTFRARTYNYRSWARFQCSTGATPKSAKKLNKKSVSTSEINFSVKSALNYMANALREKDFALVRMAKRRVRSEGGLSWYGVVDAWRVPKSEFAAFTSAKKLRERHNWVNKDVKDVAGAT